VRHLLKFYKGGRGNKKKNNPQSEQPPCHGACTVRLARGKLVLQKRNAETEEDFMDRGGSKREREKSVTRLRRVSGGGVFAGQQNNHKE